jgi:hypothetical protein
MKLPLWKKIVGVVAAIVAAPFLSMALGITIVLLAPFAIPALPVIAITLLMKERPAIVPVRSPVRRARPAYA